MNEPAGDHYTTGVANTLTFEDHEEPGMAFSESHYERIQRRILNELGGQATTIWLALAFAFLGIAASVLVTVLALPPGALGGEARAKLEACGWGAFALTLVCAVVHAGHSKDRKDTAQDVVDEMDTNCVRASRRDEG